MYFFRKDIPLHIRDNESYEADAVFFVELGEPKLEEGKLYNSSWRQTNFFAT